MYTRRISALLLLALSQSPALSSSSWDCEVLPSEQKVEADPQSGAKIIFVTTAPSSDTNFYFHNRCFLWDNRLMLFFSDRFGRTEVMGYLSDTGELLRLNHANAPAAGFVAVSCKGDRLFVSKEHAIFTWQLDIATQPRTAVRIIETKLIEMPPEMQDRSFLVENSEGSLLAFRYRCADAYFIGFCDTTTGKLLPPAQLDFKPDHLQFHWTRPDLLAFCRVYDSDVAPLDPNAPRHARFWFMNVHARVPVPAFYQVPGEIVTHECWWIHDQMTFVGGHHHEGNREEGNVKVFDLKTGEIRIIGAGAWMEDATAYQLSQVNWWHASGSPDGKWVAADNWHGIIALFNAKTTEKKILTTGHRTYGGGQHLHVGWDLTGERVEFTSNKRGNPDVCIAVLPK
ncbi:MAG TPA: hypothetical protein PKH24_18945 [Sedimentisphaerales bacterium]|jgi:hypothetical protein|nr:hypothetical protein [Sedimentisphaerales bacterium]HNU31168.1 hypothetical protein [Sedimentisphaerales bacterium]